MCSIALIKTKYVSCENELQAYVMDVGAVVVVVDAAAVVIAVVVGGGDGAR